MDDRVDVGVLGATGAVGQRLIQLLEDHPWFRLSEVCGSAASAGKTLADRLGAGADRLSSATAGLRLQAPDGPWTSSILLSALPSRPAQELEVQLAEAGHLVVSNASAHRMGELIPLLIPEVNSNHLDLVACQPWKGTLVTNPNCAAVGLVVALAPLHEAFGIESVVTTSFQSISGAGLPGPPASSLVDNVIPFIGGEEHKLTCEPQKILGTVTSEGLEPAAFPVSASCTRVAVLDGHLLAVSVALAGHPSVEEVTAAFEEYRGSESCRDLPSAPERPLQVLAGEDRPQPRLDRDLGQGMTVSVGRIRPCEVLDTKFFVLSHNLVRGAAGAALLNAELCHAQGVHGERMMTDRPLLTEVCATTAPGDFGAPGAPDGATVAMPRVHKFGGTSVDGAERLQALAAIIRDQEDRSVVVVSAMAGVSNELSQLAEAATTGGDARDPPDASTTLAALKQRHLDALQVIVKEEAARATVAARIDEIFDGATQLLGKGPGAEAERFKDQLMAVGEDLTVELAVAALQAEGIPATVLDARDIVWTDSDFGAAVPDFESIRKLAPSNILPLVEDGHVPVVQGFLGSEAGGATTTLGRGGSDFTATLLGAALGSPEVVIWTDVDGIHSGDPSLIGESRVVPHVGSEAAVELSYFGARVIHPAAAKHAIASDLPLRIKNSFAPERPGTLIHSDRDAAAAFAAVAHKTDVALIRVRAFPTALAYGFLARVFGVLGRHGVPVDLVSTSHSSTAFTVDRDEDLSAVRRALSVFSEVDVLRGVATVTVVGRGLLREPGMDALVFWAVEKTPVYLISQASDVSISFVVDEAEAPELVRRLHLSLIELKEGAREEEAQEKEASKGKEGDRR